MSTLKSFYKIEEVSALPTNYITLPKGILLGIHKRFYGKQSKPLKLSHFTFSKYVMNIYLICHISIWLVIKPILYFYEARCVVKGK